MPTKHKLLALCCIIALVSLPMVTMAEIPQVNNDESMDDHEQLTDNDPFDDSVISVSIDEDLQSENDTDPAKNTSEPKPDTLDSDADVGICVVGAGEPCN